MTAEVAIMNIHGVAMAADSAATLSSGKTYNTADKLFALSKHFPVGIMMYHNSQYMGIGWETIIKYYRNELRDKSFDTLSDYANDFINFLSKFSYVSKSQMSDYLEAVCDEVSQNVLDSFLDDLEKFHGDKGKITRQIIDGVFSNTIKDILSKMNDQPDQEHLKIDEDYIDSNERNIIDNIMRIFEDYPLSRINIQEIIKIIKLNFRKCFLMENFTGIVICGYGESDLFPTTHSFRVSGKLGNGLIYFDEEIKHIDPDETRSTILTFAQSEVVHTFIKGIDPNFAEDIDEKISFTLSTISEHISAEYKSKIPDIIELFQEYIAENIRLRYIRPVLDIVDNLDKEDLTSMAEAMINITALKRHVSTDSETVGGPIDVAYISKGDGFVWIKKKTNYDPSINLDLLQNYFNGRQR